jgi:hypothetical protein
MEAKRVQVEDGRMGSEPPQRADPPTLTACTQVDTCLPGAACTPVCICFTFSQELRIKTYPF